jgi:subtilase family serine protease
VTAGAGNTPDNASATNSSSNSGNAGILVNATSEMAATAATDTGKTATTADKFVSPTTTEAVTAEKENSDSNNLTNPTQDKPNKERKTSWILKYLLWILAILFGIIAAIFAWLSRRKKDR